MNNAETTLDGINLYSLLTESADTATSLQRNDGSFPPGNNGPWGQVETPVRNTSHWTLVFKKAHEITGKNKYKEAIESAGEYLLSDECRPHNATFKHRQSVERDQANGLIGQAWTIEALKNIYDFTRNKEYINEAIQVFLLHDFDDQMGLWHRVDTDGTRLKKDPTFNHQLWFAAAGALISDTDNEVERQVEVFLDNLTKTIRTHSNGRIYHSLHPKFGIKRYAQTLATGDRYIPLRNIRRQYYRVTPWNKIGHKNKEIGYHAFNLYAFAMLREQFPNHPVWESSIIQKTLQYISHHEYKTKINENPYGYPYNPPGFEVPYAAHVFDYEIIDPGEWVSNQIRSHFNFERGLLSRNTPDPNTLAARIYEATRLPNIDIQI